MNTVNLVNPDIRGTQRRRLDLAIACMASEMRMEAQREVLAKKEITVMLQTMLTRKRKEFYWGGNDPAHDTKDSASKRFKSKSNVKETCSIGQSMDYDDNDNDSNAKDDTKDAPSYDFTTNAKTVSTMVDVESLQQVEHDKKTPSLADSNALSSTLSSAHGHFTLVTPARPCLLSSLGRDLLLLMSTTLSTNTAISLSRLNSSFYHNLSVPIIPDPKRASMLRFRESIDLFSNDCDDDVLSRVMTHASSNLTSISLTNCRRITHDGLKAVLRHDKVRLRSIKMDNCTYICHKAICDVGLNSPLLRELYISDNSSVNDVTMFILGDKCIRLETFELNNCPFVTGSGLTSVISAQSKNLKRLALLGCWGYIQIDSINHLQEVIASCTGLTTLRVGSFKPCACGTTYCTICPDSPIYSVTHSLNAGKNCIITGLWMRDVCAKMPRLQRLDVLECPQLYSDVALLWNTLENCRQLQHLDLDGSQISDSRLIQLIDQMTNVRFLSLYAIHDGKFIQAIAQNVQLVNTLVELRVHSIHVGAKEMLNTLICCKQLRRLLWRESQSSGANTLLSEIASVNQAHTFLKRRTSSTSLDISRFVKPIKIHVKPASPTPVLASCGGMQHLLNLEQVQLQHCDDVNLTLLSSLVPWCPRLRSLTCNFDKMVIPCTHET